jgi:hypothetical protein
MSETFETYGKFPATDEHVYRDLEVDALLPVLEVASVKLVSRC